MGITLSFFLEPVTWFLFLFGLGGAFVHRAKKFTRDNYTASEVFCQPMAWLTSMMAYVGFFIPFSVQMYEAGDWGLNTKTFIALAGSSFVLDSIFAKPKRNGPPVVGHVPESGIEIPMPDDRG